MGAICATMIRSWQGLAAIAAIAAAPALNVPAARADDGFAKARERSAAYCRSLGQGAGCVKRQNSEMGHFVTMMAGFAVSRTDSESCMRQGKRGRFIDWTVATACLRQRVKGRPIGR